MLIDTHTHLNFSAFQEDRDEVIRRTLSQGVRFIMPGSQISTSKRAVEIAERYPEGVYAAVGLHPIHLETREVDVQEVQSAQVEEKPWMTFETRGEIFDYGAYKTLAQSSRKAVAIGEFGLDYYYQPKSKAKREVLRDRQKETCLAQLRLAHELNLPCIFHCRSAHADFLDLLRGFQKERGAGIKGVIHSYTGDAKQAEEYMNLGLYLGFNGLIFKNVAALPDPKEIIAAIPMERILLETDAPYLAVPAEVLTKAGAEHAERNEPRFVRFVAEEIARIKGLSFDEIARVTTQNAKELFCLNI